MIILIIIGPIINNAGGLITDWFGNKLTLNSPNHVVAVGNAALMPNVIKLLNFSEGA